MSSPTELPDVELVKALVVEAGRRALGRWGAVEAETKGDESLVTEVDRETERFIEQGVSRLDPGAAFVGEEYGRRGAEGRSAWACDPIDGTTNYVAGLPHWCVSLGLLRAGRAVLGVIYAPVLDRLYWAVEGHGAYCNGVRLACSGLAEPGAEDILCVSSNSLKTLSTENLRCRLRCLGSIALELCLAAEGRAVGAVGVYEGIVDMAAALCICGEAGCEAGYLDGTELDAGLLLSRWRTDRHFAVAPPRIEEFLRSALLVRGRAVV